MDNHEFLVLGSSIDHSGSLPFVSSEVDCIKNISSLKALRGGESELHLGTNMAPVGNKKGELLLTSFLVKKKCNIGSSFSKGPVNEFPMDSFSSSFRVLRAR